MSRAYILFILLIAGCGTLTSVPRANPLVALRQRAKSMPKDADTQSQLALAEMFSDSGDLDKLLPQIQHALSLDKDNIRIQFIAGVYYDVHGDPDQALDHYLSVIRLAPESNDTVSSQLAETAINILQGIDGSVEDYTGRVETVLDPLVQQSELLAVPARHAAGQLLIELAYRRGDMRSVKHIAHQVGCLNRFQVAGPFGPRLLLEFDNQHIDPIGDNLEDQYDLGPTRGVRPTREIKTPDCKVHLGGGPVTEGGTSYAQTFFDVPSDSEYLMRIGTPNSVEVFLDGESIHRIDRRKRMSATISYLPIKLKAGRRVITLKITTRHANPVVSMSMNKSLPKDASAIVLPFENQTIPSTLNGFSKYLQATVSFIRGDILAARESLKHKRALKHSSPYLQIHNASIALNDPLFPSEIRTDIAKRLLKSSLKKDSGFWGAKLKLAQLEAENGRITEAIASLRQARRKWPNVLAIRLSLIDLLRERDWHVEADAEVMATRKKFRESCSALQYELEAEQRLRRTIRIGQLTKQVVECDARSNARYSFLLQQRRFSEAEEELSRLDSLQPIPNQYGTLLARLELSKNRGDEEARSEILKTLRKSYPRSESAILEQADHLYSIGKVDEVSRLFKRVFTREPASTLNLRRLGKIVTGQHPLEEFRVDGRKIIEEFEASETTYEQPKLLLFDYMVVRIFEDGSALELIHNIFKAQSDEGVDELGEVRLPEGASLLKAHTIKADGRRIEPDKIQGKDTISLPNLLPGDYTEFEYVRPLDPPGGFPGGFLGDRFYFRSFEVPFDRSQLIVVLPKELPFKLDPRGNAPKAKETIRGDLRILDFDVRKSLPLIPEPLSVASREYIPSINLGVKATWEGFISSIREALIDRDIYDPSIVTLVNDIVGELTTDQRIKRAERIYTWVMRNIENTKDTFSQSAAMLRARMGNRTRVLHYMLTLAGVPSELALVRSQATDSTLSDLPDTDTYNYLLLRVIPSSSERSKSPVWVSTVDRWAPFGYIPPLLRGQHALLLKKGKNSVRVTQRKLHNDRHQVEFDIRLSSDGSAKIDVVERLHGAVAVAWRENLESIEDAELERRFEDEHVAHLVPGARMQSLKIIGRETIEQPLQLEYSFTSKAFGRSVKGGWAVPAILRLQLAASYALQSKRTTVEFVSPSIDRELLFRFHVPEGTPKPSFPDNIEIKGLHNSMFSSQIEWKPGRLTVTRKFVLPIMRVAQKDYSAFKHFCRRVDLVEAAEIVFKFSPKVSGIPQETAKQHHLERRTRHHARRWSAMRAHLCSNRVILSRALNRLRALLAPHRT